MKESDSWRFFVESAACAVEDVLEFALLYTGAARTVCVYMMVNM